MLPDTYDFLCKMSYETLQAIIEALNDEIVNAIAAGSRSKDYQPLRDYRERVESILWQVVIPFHPSPEACHHKLVLARHAYYGNG